MPNYEVKVTFKSHKTINVVARSEDEALEKATKVVENWDSVDEVEEAEIA